jgi:hypothetical protein
MFGASLAPEVFTRIMSVLHTPLRLLRGPLTFMLDDSKGGARRLGLACARLHRQLLHSLGLVVVVGLKKSSQWPSQMVKYLGFLHDLARGLVLLPPDKLARFQAGIDKLQHQ